MIYIAGSFSTEEQKKELLEMISYVRKTRAGEELFIPMEHYIPNGWDLTNSDWGRKVYEMDREAMDKSTEMFACYLGQNSGSGTSFEIGYFSAKGKPVNLYIPDSVGVTSCMCMGAATNIIYPGKRFNTPEQK